jgi:hypothetical protein
MQADDGSDSARRYHPLLLMLRYACVALLAIAGVVLVAAGVSPMTVDKSADAIAAEKAQFLVLGLFLAGTALLLAWLDGSARRWLTWALVTFALAPLTIGLTLALENEGAFHRTSDALNGGLCFIVAAAVFATLCYPASRLGRQRLRWGCAWLVGWLGLLLGGIAVGLIVNAFQPRNPNSGSMLVSAAVLVGLAASGLLASWLLVRNTRHERGVEAL